MKYPHRSRRPAITALSCAAVFCAAAFLAHAGDYYKWTDAHGTVHYSDTPPPAGASKKINVDDNAPTPPPPGMAGNAQSAPNAKANQDALHQTNAEAVSRNCATAHKNIARLQRSKIVASTDSADVRMMTPEQRTQALTDARAQATEFCATP